MKAMSRLHKILTGFILLLIIWIAVILVIRYQRGSTARGIIVDMDQHDLVEMSNKEVVSLMKKAAQDFGKYYSKDYASKYLYYKTVSGKDKYLEFVGSQGIILSCNFNQEGEVLHLLDKNSMHQWYPVGIMRSYPWDADGKSCLHIHQSGWHRVLRRRIASTRTFRTSQHRSLISREHWKYIRL